MVSLPRKSEKYKTSIVFSSKRNSVPHALDYIEAEMEATVERDEILQFVRRSQHGIMKGYAGVTPEENDKAF